MIRKARPGDLETLQAIEVLAGEAFRAVGLDAIADDDPPNLNDLRGYAVAGRAWVATDSVDSPIAYILVDEIDQGAHIAQVTVHPQRSRQGIGKALIEEVERWARSCGLQALTLTTFSEVPWNAPYYARLGFTELPEPQWTEDLHRIVEMEASQGLGAWPRVVMRRNVTAGE
ncbi:GNAT family N-acetyltransferase [Arthrobacter globiformis]|uniref:GNAT family N-acetyltransferase n=1 Tax=Arthrobacter globiformis TaxID=1665 RepID=UPI0027D8C239|nr:GNAT family N-acetyltransferase [Arthrobacter globiformis]